MKVAVLGSGNGGHAIAFEWAKAGHDVYMFDFEKFDKAVSAITLAGGIYSQGALEGFQKIVYAGHDIEKVVTGAELVFAVGPAYSTEAFGKACRPYIKPGQICVVCPGSCMGSVVFKNALGLSIEDDSVIIAETSTLPYAVRIIGDARIDIYNRLPAGCMMAALPHMYTDMVFDMLSSVHWGIEKAENVFQTTFQNSNPVIHPAITTLNAARIESTHGDFYFYEEGVTTSVGRLVKAIDEERLLIGRTMGLTLERDPSIGIRQGYMAEDSYDIGFSKAPGFKGIKAQPQLDYRYYNEDAGYGLVFMTNVADKLGVEVPAMKALLKIVSIIMDRDYKAEQARTLGTLGLAKYSVDELLSIV